MTRAKTVGKTRRKLLEATDAREAKLLQWPDIFNVMSGVWWGEKLIKNLTDKASRDAAIIRASDELLSAESIPALTAQIFPYDLEGDLRKITVPPLILEIVTQREDVSIGRQGSECSLLSLMHNLRSSRSQISTATLWIDRASVAAGEGNCEIVE